MTHPPRPPRPPEVPGDGTSNPRPGDDSAANFGTPESDGDPRHSMSLTGKLFGPDDVSAYEQDGAQPPTQAFGQQSAPDNAQDSRRTHAAGGAAAGFGAAGFGAGASSGAGGGGAGIGGGGAGGGAGGHGGNGTGNSSGGMSRGAAAAVIALVAVLALAIGTFVGMTAFGGGDGNNTVTAGSTSSADPGGAGGNGSSEGDTGGNGAGGGSGDSADEGAAAASPTQSSGAASESPSTSSSPSLIGKDATTFQSPSTNIACAIDSGIVRCDIGHRTYDTPDAPDDCSGSYGNSFVADGDGSRLACVSDSVADEDARVLGYGSELSDGGVTCKSEKTGMTCTVDATGHGFTIASAEYTLF